MVTDGIPLYDYAAGRLIASEAGARTTDFRGADSMPDDCDTFLISNDTAIHDCLIQSVTAPLNAAHAR